MADDDAIIHSNLVRWIAQNGGVIHRNLALHTPASSADKEEDSYINDDGDSSSKESPGRFSRRGIFAKHGHIDKGEILARLPSHLGLDGSHLPARYDATITQPDDNNNIESTHSASYYAAGQPPTTSHHQGQQQQRNASPWLRCLASLMNAWCHSSGRENQKEDVTMLKSTLPARCNFYKHYLSSLPKAYDSLLNWSVVEIKSFLAGTTLRSVTLQDANDATPINVSEKRPIAHDEREKGMQQRFLTTVVPYLMFLKNNGFNPEGKGMGGDDDGTTDATNIGDTDASDAQTHKRQKIALAIPAVIGDEKANEMEHMYPLFREGCMCISTRAFHMQSPTAEESDTNPNDCYQGPYLLPYIDLLNHSPWGSFKHVTTLRRSPDGSFVMLAERDIAIGEEICHSYNSSCGTDGSSKSMQGQNAKESCSLNSAQLLQTFGFVDVNEASKKLLDYCNKKGKHNDDSADTANFTPALLTKKEISHACRQLASSSYPDKLRKFMDNTGMLDEGWECWQMPTVEETGTRFELLQFFPDEFIIPFGKPLSDDELITTCCLHFLPDEAVKVLLDESTTKEGNRQSLLLGIDALDDCFLGCLVLQTVLNALEEKLNTYKISSVDVLAGCNELEQTRQFLDVLGEFYPESESHGRSFSWGESETLDASALSKVMSLQEVRSNDLLQKFACGMIVSLEERTCLLEFKRTILHKLAQLSL